MFEISNIKFLQESTIQTVKEYFEQCVMTECWYGTVVPFHWSTEAKLKLAKEGVHMVSYLLNPNAYPRRELVAYFLNPDTLLVQIEAKSSTFINRTKIFKSSVKVEPTEWVFGYEKEGPLSLDEDEDTGYIGIDPSTPLEAVTYHLDWREHKYEIQKPEVIR